MIKKIIKKLTKRVLKLLTLFQMKYASSSLSMSMEEAQDIISNKYFPEKVKWGIENSKEDDFDLSIIVPIYNAEKYLKTCIESILWQKTTYRYEVICIDDGSIDSSSKILDSYTGEPNLKIIHQCNHGISYARNVGLQQATGQFVLFVDNDDYLNENFVQQLLDIATIEDADIVKCGYQIFSEKKKFVKNVCESTKRIYKDGLNNEILTYGGFVWGSVIRRSLFQNISFPNGFWYEDMITRLWLYRVCKTFVYLDDILYYYRVHDKNASKIVWSTKKYKSLDQFFLAVEIEKHSKNMGIVFDEWTYRLYLNEFGQFLYQRTICLESELRQAVFVLAGDFMRQHKSYINIQTSLSFAEKVLDEAFQKNDFKLWERISLLCQI